MPAPESRCGRPPLVPHAIRLQHRGEQWIEEYLKRFPSGSCAGAAIDRLEELLWEKTEGGRELGSILLYLERYPAGRHALELRSNMEEALWQETLALNTLQGYAEFADRFPSSAHGAAAIAGARAHRLLVLLGDDDRSVRESAQNALVELGRPDHGPVVELLAEKMTYEGKRWTREISRTSHCGVEEVVTEAYYAANALLRGPVRALGGYVPHPAHL